MIKKILSMATGLIIQNSAFALFNIPHQGDAFPSIFKDLNLTSESYQQATPMSEIDWHNLVRTQVSSTCHLNLEQTLYPLIEKSSGTSKMQREEAYDVLSNAQKNHLQFYHYDKEAYFYKKIGNLDFRISNLGGGKLVLPSSFELNGVKIPTLDYIIWQDNLFSLYTSFDYSEKESSPMRNFLSAHILPSVREFYNDIQNTFSKNHMERSLLKVRVDVSTGSLLAIATLKTIGPTHYTSIPTPEKRMETNCIISAKDYALSMRLIALQSHLQNNDIKKSNQAIDNALKNKVPAQAIISALTSNKFGTQLLKSNLPKNRDLLVAFFERHKLFHKDFVKDIISLAQEMDLSNIVSLENFLTLDFNSYSEFLLDIMQRHEWPKVFIINNFKRLDNEQKRLWFTDLIGKKHLDKITAQKLFDQYASPLYLNNQEFSDAMMLMADKDYITHNEMVNKTYKFLGGNWPKDFNKFIPKELAREKIERELIHNESSLGIAKLYFEMAYGEDAITNQTITDFYQVSNLTSIQEYKLLKAHPELAEEMMIKALKDPTVKVPPMHTSAIYEKMSIEQRKKFLDSQLQKLVEETPKRLSAYNTLIAKLDSLFKDHPSSLNHLRSFLAEMVVSGQVDIDENNSPIFSHAFLQDEFINEFTDTLHFKKAVELGDIKFLLPDDSMLIVKKLIKAYPSKYISTADYNMLKDYEEWLSYQQDGFTEEDKKIQQNFSQHVYNSKVSLINQAEKYPFKDFDEILDFAKKWKSDYQSFGIQTANDLVPFHNAIAKLLWDKNNWEIFINKYFNRHELLDMMFIENALKNELTNLHSAEVFDLVTQIARDYPIYKDDEFLKNYITHYLVEGVPEQREQDFIEILQKYKSKLHYILEDLSKDQLHEKMRNIIYPSGKYENTQKDFIN